MRSRALAGYLTIALLGIGGYLLTTDGTWSQNVLKVAVGYFGVAGILVGVRRHRPVGRAAWWCFAAGVFLNCTGQLVEQIVGRYTVVTFLSVADAFYLSLYPALALGLTLLIRLRTERHDGGAMVEAATISTGLGLLSWVFLIRPATDDPRSV